MKQEILEYVKKYGGVTFAELSRIIPGFKGDKSLSMPELSKRNIFIWDGVSDEAAQALVELLEKKEIKMGPCNPLLYVMDGVVPNMKVAKAFRFYKEPRWMPVILN